jgi:membrane protease YdiL (CAAX protease family)
MNTITTWIRRRPLVAFYLICFAISWGLWLPVLLYRTDITELVGIVGVFGPALACVFVSRTSSSDAKDSSRLSYRMAFFAGWIISTMAFFFYSGAFKESSWPIVLVIFSILGLVPAYIIASAVSGPSGVRRTLSSIMRPKGWWGWYVLALALPVAFRLISVWLSRQLGWELLSDPEIPTNLLELAGSILVVFLYTLIFAGGLDEETGWTGMALPGLQARFSPLVATFIVWALWMLWHVPMHMVGFFNLSAHVLVGSFLGRFLLTWLFMRSSGGVLTAILLHTSVNVTSQFVPLTYASLIVDAAVAILVIVAGKMWRRQEQDHAFLAEKSLADG